VEYRLYKNFEAYADGESFSNSCYLLAVAYRNKGMFMKAANYVRQQIAIAEKEFKEFESFMIIKRLMGAYRILGETYKLLQRNEDATDAYEKELQYTKMLYQGTGDSDILNVIFVILMDMEKYYMSRGDYDRLIDGYTELLREYDMLDGADDEEKQEDIRKDIDYIKCILGKLYYVTGTNLFQAREAKEASSCPYPEFTKEDREFYLGKIDALLINDMVERYYPSEEEKKQIMSSDE
jgi:tetratricopeptide (TPR) repeat protein